MSDRVVVMMTFKFKPRLKLDKKNICLQEREMRRDEKLFGVQRRKAEDVRGRVHVRLHRRHDGVGRDDVVLREGLAALRRRRRWGRGRKRQRQQGQGLWIPGTNQLNFE